MSTEKLVESLARQISRRDFLKTLGAGAIATLLAFLGPPETASGTHGGCAPGLYDRYCCCLCKIPGSTTCTTCAWCWSCGPWGPRGDYYSCCECHKTNDGCPGSGCSNVDHSYVRLLGHAPQQANQQPEQNSNLMPK